MIVANDLHATGLGRSEKIEISVPNVTSPKYHEDAVLVKFITSFMSLDREFKIICHTPCILIHIVSFFILFSSGIHVLP